MITDKKVTAKKLAEKKFVWGVIKEKVNGMDVTKKTT